MSLNFSGNTAGRFFSFNLYHLYQGPAVPVERETLHPSDIFVVSDLEESFMEALGWYQHADGSWGLAMLNNADRSSQ